MKNFILLVALFLVAPFAQGSSPQHLLVGGSGWNKIAIINKDTKEIVWEYPLEKGWECNSVAATKAGEILFSYSKGAKMITRDGGNSGISPHPQDVRCRRHVYCRTVMH